MLMVLLLSRASFTIRTTIQREKKKRTRARVCYGGRVLTSMKALGLMTSITGGKNF